MAAAEMKLRVVGGRGEVLGVVRVAALNIHRMHSAACSGEKSWINGCGCARSERGEQQSCCCIGCMEDWIGGFHQW
mgnify:CR=1 FL=1